MSVAICRELIYTGDWQRARARGLSVAKDPRTRAALSDTHSAKSRDGFAPQALQAAIHFVDTHDRYVETCVPVLSPFFFTI